jgi:hypothetical protein
MVNVPDDVYVERKGPTGDGGTRLIRTGLSAVVGEP